MNYSFQFMSEPFMDKNRTYKRISLGSNSMTVILPTKFCLQSIKKRWLNGRKKNTCIVYLTPAHKYGGNHNIWLSVDNPSASLLLFPFYVCVCVLETFHFSVFHFFSKCKQNLVEKWLCKLASLIKKTRVATIFASIFWSVLTNSKYFKF